MDLLSRAGSGKEKKEKKKKQEEADAEEEEEEAEEAEQEPLRIGAFITLRNVPTGAARKRGFLGAESSSRS